MSRARHDPDDTAALRRGLLAWYRRNRRELPWRGVSDPYAIWVSEVMLQQTRVAVVVERYQAFLKRFPSLVSLALAPEQEVLALWSGLGYYRRARMLHKTAQFVAAHHHGNLPVTAEELRRLPGIGPYTAAAIASIGHGEPAAVVDGNVERVLCRLKGWDAAGPHSGVALRRNVETLASQLLNPAAPGDFNQAIMELGATVCLPRNPRCPDCPLHAACATRGEHKTAPKPRMQSRQVAYALSVRAGRRPGPTHREVLLEQRPEEHTIMPGLWELPLLRDADVPAPSLRMTLRHAIMHINYFVRIRTVFEDDVPQLAVAGGERQWVPLSRAGSVALTGLARKVLTRTHLLPAMAPRIVASGRRADVP